MTCFRKLGVLMTLGITVLALLLTVAPASAIAKKKKKSRHEITLGARTGGLFDSNVFNKKTGKETAFGNETQGKIQYNFKISKKVKWKNEAAFGTSYRSGDAAVEALKLNPKFKTGFTWNMFGNSSKKNFSPTGKLSFGVNYNGVFNPTLNNPTENVDVIDVDDEVDDVLEDAGNDDDGDDFGMDDMDDEGDDEAEDGEEGDDDDGEDNEDPVGGKFFNSKPPRHTYGGNVGFAYSPTKKATLGIGTKAAIGNIGETAGNPSPDFWQWGSGVKFSHKFLKKNKLTLSTGYGLGLRFWNEKTTAAGDKMRLISHSFQLGAKYKPIKRLKFITSYSYGLRDIPPNTPANSYAHAMRFGVDVMLIKRLYAFAENNVLVSGRIEDDTKDALRYQGIVGVKGSLKFKP